MRRTELKAMSDKQRKLWAERGNPWPTSTLTARKPKPGKRTDTGPDRATVDVVLERDGYSCVVCGDALHGTRGFDFSVHHRVRRSQGGDNRLSNLVSVCGHGTAGCHGDIHGAVAKAFEAGWLVSRCDNPAETLMAHASYGFVLLLDDGGIRHSRKDDAA